MPLFLLIVLQFGLQDQERPNNLHLGTLNLIMTVGKLK